MIGIVLAGGEASRLGGGDKGLRLVGRLPILDRIVATMSRQCDGVVINANGDSRRLDRFGLVVVPDDVPGHPGPLAGILAGLDWVAAHRPDTRTAIVAPTDTPFLPDDFVERLRAAATDTIVCARSNDRAHPIASLWPIGLRHALRDALVTEGLRKVSLFQARHGVRYVDWPTHPFDPFFNANTPDDLAAAEAIAAMHETD